MDQSTFKKCDDEMDYKKQIVLHFIENDLDLISSEHFGNDEKNRCRRCKNWIREDFKVEG